jgi:hypothetical protein
MLRRLLGGVAHRLTGYDAVRVVVGILLLTAAGLKGYQLATEPSLGTGFLDSRWLLTATVEFELLFGLWLLANLWPKLSWAAAMGCFSLFACVSLYKALSGDATCGCFGRVPVNPWWTAVLDLVVVLSFLRWQPKGQDWLFFVHFKEFGLPTVAVLSIWLVLGLAVAFAIGTYTAATLSEAGDVVGNGRMVVLTPERWLGKRFPLLDYIAASDQLKRGNWFVLLYHHDCPTCRGAIGDLPRILSRLGAKQVALIELPPYGDEIEAHDFKGITLTDKQLDNAREWFVESPVGLLIGEGVVFDVRQADWFAEKAASNAGHPASASAATAVTAVTRHGNS